MPPLWIWALVLTAAFSITFVLYKLTVKEKEKDFAAKMVYAQQAADQAGMRPVILIIGSSLTQCGLDSTKIMEDYIEKVCSIRPVIIKIWRKGTSLSSIVEAMPGLKKINPSLLVVEANMLCYAPIERTFSGNNISEVLTGLTNSGKMGEKYAADAKSNYKNEELRFLKYRNGVVDTPDLVSFRQFGFQLHSKGTRIILANFPLEASQEIIKWHSTDADLFQRNFRYVRKLFPYKYINPDMGLDASFYFDGAHMNKKGSKAYSKWLCNEIAREL